MKTYRLIRRQKLATDMQAAWQFFSNPANLSSITPPWLDFQITSRLPQTIYAGLIITYRIRPIAGIAVPWVSEITQVDAPVSLWTSSVKAPTGSGITSTISGRWPGASKPSTRYIIVCPLVCSVSGFTHSS
jgi:ligand-binding SRPBCC domain-containing protein